MDVHGQNMVEVAIEYEYETDKKTIYMQSRRLQNGWFRPFE